MTRQELIDYCLTFPSAYEDYPFDDIADASAWTVVRHRINKKSFALIYERNGRLCVNRISFAGVRGRGTCLPHEQSALEHGHTWRRRVNRRTETDDQPELRLN